MTGLSRPVTRTHEQLVAADWLGCTRQSVSAETLSARIPATYHLAPLAAAPPTGPPEVIGLQLNPTEVIAFWTGIPTAPKRKLPAAELASWVEEQQVTAPALHW